MFSRFAFVLTHVCTVLLVAITLLNFSATTEVHAIFFDGFEYTDSPLNHGWTAGFGSPGPDPSVISTSTEQQFSGSRSLKIGRSNVGLTYSFADFEFGTNLDVSVRFYDDLHTGFNHEKWARVFFDDGKNAIIQAYNNSTNFTTTYLADYYHPNGNISSSNNNTGVSRTLGWHEFRFVVEDNLLDLYVDGTKALDNVLSVSTLASIHLLVGETGPGYFDDVLVVVPEPSTLLLFGIAVLGGLGYGWLRRKKVA